MCDCGEPLTECEACADTCCHRCGCVAGVFDDADLAHEGYDRSGW